VIRVSAQDRIRELEAAAPFARTLGMELLEADPELVTQTQVFGYGP
jgi:hypothetical protein